MIGWTPCARAASKNLIAPKRLDWSVIASAGMPSAAAAVTASSTRAMPSTMEYSVCRRRWTNCGAVMRTVLGRRSSILPATVGEKGPQHGGAFLREEAAFEHPVVVPMADCGQVDDAAAGAGLGIARAEHHACDARVDHGADAHRARLERDVELAA